MDKDQIIRELNSAIIKQNSVITKQNDEISILQELLTQESELEIKGKPGQNKF